MKKATLLLAVLLLAATISILGIVPRASAQGRATVTVSRENHVSGEAVFLRDIANIKSDDPSLTSDLASTYIGRAPLPGRSRSIKLEQIRRKIRQKGIPLAAIGLKSPSQIKVLRNYNEIKGDTVEKIVRKFILQKMPWDPGQVNIKGLDFDGNIILPKGKITYRLIPQVNENYLGSTPIQVVFAVDGKPQKKVWLNADIEVYTPVVVSARPMPRYHVVSKSDIRLERRNLADLPSNIITSLEEPIGKRIKAPLSANTPLRADLIELPPLVKRGDIVTVIAENEVLKIVTKGMVKDRGRKGDVVRVININSKKEVFGKVVDARTVRVNF
jgi:flagella basal body P-ring formation protein FlgA